MYNEEAPKEQSLVQKFVQLEDRREMSAMISEITKGLAPVEAAPVIDDFLKATFSEYMNTNKTEEQIKETLRQCGLYHHIHIFDDFDQIKKDSIGTWNDVSYQLNNIYIYLIGKVHEMMHL